MALGIIIRMGSGGFSLSAPEGSSDLRPLSRDQLGTFAGMLSDAMGLKRGPSPSAGRRHGKPTVIRNRSHRS